MEEKLFRKNDSGFVCVECGRIVPPLGYSSRNHCPYCLCSLHIDINPGDRANGCGGVMDAVSAAPSRNGFVITHRCRKCGAVRRCRSADRGDAPDDRELLIALTVNSGFAK